MEIMTGFLNFCTVSRAMPEDRIKRLSIGRFAGGRRGLSWSPKTFIVIIRPGRKYRFQPMIPEKPHPFCPVAGQSSMNAARKQR